LSDTGLQTLCSALHHNTSLQELDIRNNQIQASGAQIIADLIRANKTLKKIDLKWNDIGRQGGSYILHAVQENTMIQYIELTGNKGTEDVSRALDPILQKNRGEIGGMIDQLTNVKGSAKDIPYDILRKEREYAEDLKAKFEA
jgi:Ran GTPase-activating protein (RanGAP) involved in mRNA processing and transport